MKIAIFTLLFSPFILLGYRGEVTGWYWVAGWDSNVPYVNTCHCPCDTILEAKRQAAEHVNNHLKQ